MAKLCEEFNVSSTRSVMLAKDELARSGAATVLVAALSAVTAPVQPSELDLPMSERRAAAYAMVADLYADGKGLSSRDAARRAAGIDPAACTVHYRNWASH